MCPFGINNCHPRIVQDTHKYLEEVQHGVQRFIRSLPTSKIHFGLQLVTNSNSSSWESCFSEEACMCAHTAPCLLSVPAHAEQNQHVFSGRSSIAHLKGVFTDLRRPEKKEKKSVHY